MMSLSPGQKRIGIMLELIWPYRRHVDLFAGTQRYAAETGRWFCEVDEFLLRSGHGQDSSIGIYDGIVARVTPELAEQARRHAVPVVNVWFNSPVRDEIPGVFPDFAKVGEEAAQHLLAQGHRRFACLSVRRDAAHQLMVSRFHEALASRGFACRCAHTHPLFYTDAAKWARFRTLLDDWISSWTPPLGLFVAFNDVTARYVVHACHRHGLRIPDDVALITATNEEAVAHMPSPSLSSVEVNYEQIGYRAAALLDNILAGDSAANPPETLAPVGVIPRESTDFFAVDDAVVAAAMRFIEQSIRRRITTADVAEAAGVTTRTLERRFKAAAHRSVSVEIRRLRIAKAKRLLSETDLLVKEIARQAGFGDPARLHEVFVREVGVAPSAYRARTGR